MIDKWTAFDASDLAGALGLLIEGLLISMLVLAPLPLGSVAPWAQSALFLCACVLLFLWAARSALLGRVEIIKTPLWFFAAGYLLILGLQMIPLPHFLLAMVSPKTAELYAGLLPGYPDASGPMPVSLNAYATAQEIYRLLTLGMVLFVFINHFRERCGIVRVLWALVLVGLFQAFYGLAERFSGNPHIFWIRPGDAVSVHGTYYNRNHFAGLMEMLTPTVFGFFLASLAVRRRSWRPSGQPLFQRLEQALSKGRAYRNVLLGMVVAAMFLAGMLSLSRGGAAGLLVGFLILFGFTRGKGERGARAVRIFAFVLLAALGLLLYRGVGGIVDRFERLSEEDSSWEGRKALREAGVRMFEDFPLLGVGGRAFRYVFPAYQPDRYGDRAARYLHDDWLQVACETGVLGAGVAWAGIGLFLLGLVRALRRREDRYGRLVFAGAFAGVVAMLVHSLMDFNLYMVPANGLVFVVLLGICHTAVHMKGRARGSASSFRVRSFDLRGPAARAGLPVIVFAGCLAMSIPAVRRARADFAFNRYRVWATGSPELYFFWERPAVSEAAARQALARAVDLEACSSEYHYALGMDRIRAIREKIRAEARERARSVLLGKAPADRSAEGTARGLARKIERALETKAPAVQEDSEAFQGLVTAFMDPVRRGMQEEILAGLAAAERPFRRAMRIAPTVPWYRISLATAYADLLTGPGLDAVRPEVARLIRQGLELAPNRPAGLFAAGLYEAREILEEEGALDPARPRDGRALALLKRALAGEPARYAVPAYEFLVDRAGLEPGVLLEITPGTLGAQRRLEVFCRHRGLWPQALGATNRVLRLLGFDPDGSDIPPDVPSGSVAFRLGKAMTGRQVRTLQRLGRIDSWRTALARYRSFVEIQCGGLLEDASRYRALGRLTEAGKACRDCLALDWNNLDAFLALAEIRLLPGGAKAGESRSEMFREILRQLDAHPSPGPAECERIEALLERVTPETPVEHLEAGLAEAVRQRACGAPEEAARALRALLLVDAGPFVYWHQRHLLHYQLGRALELSGEVGDAEGEYEKAVALAPAHRPSLRRLVALGLGDRVPGGREDAGGPAGDDETDETGSEGSVGRPAFGERLLGLTPAMAWDIDFAGKVRFLGLSLEGDSVGGAAAAGTPGEGGRNGFTVRYYWQITADLDPRDYTVVYRGINREGDVVYRGRKSLFPRPGAFGENLDGGIGTVLLHWDYLPFPPETLAEVRIYVQPKRKGKAVGRPLRVFIGDRALVLGVGGDFFQKKDLTGQDGRAIFVTYKY